MSTTQPLINQFGLSSVQGQIDLIGLGSNVITCQVDNAQATSLAQGQAVKLATTAGGVPKVIGLAANTDVSFGFVARNVKDAAYPANSYCEVALINSVMWMTSGAAITRGAKLEVVYTTNKVITNAGTNPVVGFALDTATGADQLIRVYIITQSYQSAQVIADVAGLQAALDTLTAGVLADVKTARVAVTLAELNAGKEIVPAVTGKKIRVLNYAARVVGNFTTNTSADLQSGTTGTKVTALGQAGLTNGAILQPTSSNTTLGAGFAADLETSENLKVANIGTAAAGGTSITYTVTYAYV